MPIKQGWFLKDRIMFFIYEGDVSLDELREAVNHAASELDKARRPIHGIHHFGGVTGFPVNIAAIHQAVAPSMGHVRMGHFVGVGIQDAHLQLVGRMIGHLTRTPIWLVPTMQDAVQYLSYKDDTLPDLYGIDCPVDDNDTPMAI